MFTDKEKRKDNLIPKYSAFNYFKLWDLRPNLLFWSHMDNIHWKSREKKARGKQKYEFFSKNLEYIVYGKPWRKLSRSAGMTVCFTRNLLLKQKFSRENKGQVHFLLNDQEITTKE